MEEPRIDLVVLYGDAPPSGPESLAAALAAGFLDADGNASPVSEAPRVR